MPADGIYIDPVASTTSGIVGTAYSQTLTLSSVVTIISDPYCPPYTVTVASGSLPPGLSLVPDLNSLYIIRISGTPTTPGTYTFTINATGVACDT